jgi:hypothetical protein
MKVQQFSSNKGGIHAASSDCFGESLFIMGQFGGNDFLNMLIASNMTLEQARSFVPEIVNTISIGVEVCCMCYDGIA